ERSAFHKLDKCIKIGEEPFLFTIYTVEANKCKVIKILLERFIPAVGKMGYLHFALRFYFRHLPNFLSGGIKFLG
ncbi:hypothetical protein, partial [uncultured Dysgonomonas sp.]|uniref:hypothetical protein n=1 Tax=uncultured Dysgonomonas sp. TaxID=206096 RepID=UPI00262952CD